MISLSLAVILGFLVVGVALLMIGFPVAIALSGVAILFAGLGGLLGTFDQSFLFAIPVRIFGLAMTNETLIAVPLFIFMGLLLQRTRIAEEMLESMGLLFGRLRGGLGLSVFVVGGLLAATTGVVGATVVSMGLISLPTMLRHGYSPRLAAGAIAASGTLGQIIPPSVILVVLGDQISVAYAEAQRAKGIWAPEPVTVADLFAGALLPGLMLVGLYMLYQIALAVLAPATCPPVLQSAASATGEDERSVVGRALAALLPPTVLIIATLGSVLAGLATPTESAGIGSAAALVLGGLRTRHPARPLILAAPVGAVLLVALVTVFGLRLGSGAAGLAQTLASSTAGIACLAIATGLGTAVYVMARAGTLRGAMTETAKLSSMAFVILIGATLFSLVFRGLGGDKLIHDALATLPGGPFAAMLTVMAVMFLLGFFLDFIEIIFVVVPLVAPPLLSLGLDPVWLGVMMALNLQTSFLTPPFGFALFYLRSVAGSAIRTSDIYIGIIPFVCLQLLALALLWALPGIATVLPAAM